MSVGTSGLLQERMATVRTDQGTLEFLTRDGAEFWTPGRALAGASRLCERIVARAGLKADPWLE